MAQVDQHHCQVKRDYKQHSKEAGLLTLSSSADACVSSSAQALVSMVTSIPVKDAATPLQAINTFMPSYRFRQRRVIADTSYLSQCMHFVGRLSAWVQTLQKVSWLSNTQASTSVSIHWPPAPQVLVAKASLVSSGKASQGHWRLAVTM